MGIIWGGMLSPPAALNFLVRRRRWLASGEDTVLEVMIWRAAQTVVVARVDVE